MMRLPYLYRSIDPKQRQPWTTALVLDAASDKTVSKDTEERGNGWYILIIITGPAFPFDDKEPSSLVRNPLQSFLTLASAKRHPHCGVTSDQAKI